MTKNKKNITIFLMTLFVVGFSVFSFSESALSYWDENAKGLVKCGKTDPSSSAELNYLNRCELCDLVIGIKNIIDWGMKILVAVSLTAITAGGIMYIISAGDEQMMQSAKNVIKQALWGVVVVLGAWLIVTTTLYVLAAKGNLGIGVTSWNTFDCSGSSVGSDSDNDGINDDEDNSPYHNNPDQADSDGDGVGDASDICNGDDASFDTDGDGTCNDLDNDDDGDGVPDASDSCPDDWNPDQVDSDGDGCDDDEPDCEGDGNNCSNSGDCCSNSCLCGSNCPDPNDQTVLSPNESDNYCGLGNPSSDEVQTPQCSNPGPGCDVGTHQEVSIGFGLSGHYCHIGDEKVVYCGEAGSGEAPKCQEGGGCEVGREESSQEGYYCVNDGMREFCEGSEGITTPPRCGQSISEPCINGSLEGGAEKQLNGDYHWNCVNSFERITCYFRPPEGFSF